MEDKIQDRGMILLTSEAMQWIKEVEMVGLYKLRIRESEKLKTVLELYDLEIHQKKAGPDDHRLKTMVKRSIEQNLRIKNFEARNGNHETNARRGQESVDNSVKKEFMEIVGNGKPTGSVLKETIAVSVMISMSVQKQRGRMREMRREPEVPEATVPVVECLDCPARITPKELAPFHSVKMASSRILVLQVREWMQIW